MSGLNVVLNQAAGTTDLEAPGAAAFAAGQDLSLVGALNAVNGSVGLGLNAVANALAGTTGLEFLAALRVWAAAGGGVDAGGPLSEFLDLLDGGTPASAGVGVFDAGGV